MGWRQGAPLGGRSRHGLRREGSGTCLHHNNVLEGSGGGLDEALACVGAAAAAAGGLPRHCHRRRQQQRQEERRQAPGHDSWSWTRYGGFSRCLDCLDIYCRGATGVARRRRPRGIPRCALSPRTAIGLPVSLTADVYTRPARAGPNPRDQPPVLGCLDLVTARWRQQAQRCPSLQVCGVTEVTGGTRGFRSAGNGFSLWHKFEGRQHQMRLQQQECRGGGWRQACGRRH